MCLVPVQNLSYVYNINHTNSCKIYAQNVRKIQHKICFVDINFFSRRMHTYLHDNDYGNVVWFKEATNF